MPKAYFDLRIDLPDEIIPALFGSDGSVGDALGNALFAALESFRNWEAFINLEFEPFPGFDS